MAKTFTSSLPSVSTGDVYTASAHNNVITTLNNHTVPPACAVYHTAAQSVPNATWTTVLFNSEYYDTDAMHDTATNTSRITISTTGIYLLTANILFDIGGTGNRQVDFMKNGSGFIYRGQTTNNISASFFTDVSTSTMMSLTAGDYMEVIVYQTNGAALNIRGDAGGVHFAAAFMGKTA